jgi:thymidylate synthase (FAD)
MSAENKNTLVPSEFPASHAEVFSTPKGVLYLKEPGVAMIGATAVNISNLEKFLNGFPKEYNFPEYLNDPTILSPYEQLVKVAGQVCYASFGEKRTWNVNVSPYVLNLIQSGHGSVLQHVNFSFLFYGISRSFTHEMVRHGAGTAFSQLSQRYVSGRVLRFVERPEYQNDEFLHQKFINRIEKAYDEYEEIAEYLAKKQQEGSSQILTAEHKTDLRKKVQQAARSVLPNETETSKIMTANVRAWRHIINMRASEHAEVEIRKGAFKIYEILNQVAPVMFQDFEVVNLPDGTKAVKTNNPKV